MPSLELMPAKQVSFVSFGRMHADFVRPVVACNGFRSINAFCWFEVISEIYMIEIVAFIRSEI